MTMQDHRHLYVSWEAIVAGQPKTGLTPTCTIRRESDLKWWSDVGQTWQATPEDIIIPEVDAVNLPGKYKYFLGDNAVDLTAGAKGYSAFIVEDTYRLKAHVDIEQTDPGIIADMVWDEAQSDHTIPNTMGEAMGTLSPTTKISAG